MLSKFLDFLLKKNSKKNIKKLSFFKKGFYKSIKIVWIATYNVFKNQLVLRASALTYFSLLAIVPFFAIIFAIAQKMGYQTIIEQELLERFQEQKEILVKVIEFAKNLILEAKGGIIALFGTIFLFLSLIKLFSHLEKSLNIIWKIKTQRNVKRRVSNYLALMFVMPLFLVILIALKIYISNVLSLNAFVHSIFKNFIVVLPFLLVFIFFTFLYSFMPKCRVKIKYAMACAFISSLMYQCVQFIYVKFQIGITQFNAIYGSFAALPLFLIWVQISWMIFLFGVELNFTMQNLSKLHLKSLKNNIT